jgi:hypothetical protein
MYRFSVRALLVSVAFIFKLFVAAIQRTVKYDWTGLDWTGLDWTGLDWMKLQPAKASNF